MKVLLIGNFYSQSGVRPVCQDLADQLSSLNWSVSTTSKRQSRLLRLIDMLYTIWKLRHWFQVAHIDLFSGPSFIWAQLATILLTLVNRPYIVTLHGGNLPEYSKTNSRRVRNVLKRATIVTTPSRYLMETMQVYRPDIILIPNAISLQNYEFVVRTSPTPNLVWLRAFAMLYNPTLAAQVTRALQFTYPRIHLNMAGPDKEDGSLSEFQSNVIQLGIKSNVITRGAITKADVPNFLQSGDVYLNTTNVDNTPVTVIEAMACGLCVVSTNVGGIPYLLEHNHDALLVPPNDPQAMADAVHRILTEPGLGERLSRNARAKAERFNWPAILLQWESLLINVIERNQRG